MAISKVWLKDPPQLVARSFPETIELVKAHKNIRIRLGEGSSEFVLSDYDLGIIYKEVVNAWESFKTLGRLTSRTLKRAPFVMIRDDLGSQLLAENQPLLKNYLDWLGQARNPRAVASLLREFLLFYNPKASWFEPVRAKLVDLTTNPQTFRMERIQSRCKKFHFIHVDGAQKFTAEFFQEQRSIDETLRLAGLEGSLSNKGFVEFAFRSLVAAVKSHIKQKTITTKALSTFLDWASSSDGTFRYPAHTSELINALLEPFANGDDPQLAKNTIFSFLMKYAGDPRIQKRHWNAVSTTAKSVIYRWLVKSSLEDFFRLLRYVSENDPNAQRMWLYRQAFWTAYLKRNVIEEAWVILGTQARQVVHQQPFKEARGKYGDLIGGNIDPLHSVLLMRIGALVIAEWSHNGKCHFWKANESNIPKLYQSSYTRDDLRNEVFNSGRNDPPFIHTSSESYNWQNKISGYIRRQTSIRVQQKEFHLGR